MERVKLNEQVSISRLVHGHWRLADWKLSSQEILGLLEKYMEVGITTIDHADIYGGYSCESLFGTALALKPELRSKIQIVTKCGIKLISDKRPDHYIKHYDTSKEHIIQSVENSLKNFNTDYIDLLLIHRPDPFMNPEEVAEAFSTLKQSGKVLSFGVSNFLPSQFNMLSSYLDFPLVTNQIEVSPTCLEYFENGGLDHCLEKRIQPMAWSPLGGGRLFTTNDERSLRVRKTLEKVRTEVNAGSISTVVYAWLLSHPAGIVPVIGSGYFERIKEAVDAVDIKLTRQQWFEIYESSRGKAVD